MWTPVGSEAHSQMARGFRASAVSTASPPPGTAKFVKLSPKAVCSASAPGSSSSSAFLYSLRSVRVVGDAMSHSIFLQKQLVYLGTLRATEDKAIDQEVQVLSKMCKLPMHSWRESGEPTTFRNQTRTNLSVL